jgi:large subunit ribosomal protein L6
MSRIGRLPIDIPAGVTVTLNDQTVTVAGKLGTLTQDVDKTISVKVEGNQVVLTRANETGDVKAKHGLYRQLIANMVKGVSEGFSKTLNINGVGYKATLQGTKVVLNIGFSHPIDVVPTEGIKLAVNGNDITVSGIDKAKVGQFAAKIRDLKPVEPYHAYGIKYADEVVIRKEGKTSGKK